MLNATVDLPSLTLTTTPTSAQLHAWWDTMWADPKDLRVAFSDLMPRSLLDFLASDILLILTTAGPYCISAVWLHDLERGQGQVIAGWLGGWVAPAFRGCIGITAVRMAVTHFQARGIRHLFSAVHVANRASIALNAGRRMLGFTRVMVYHAFLPYAGLLTDCLIFTLHPEDAGRAIRAADRRVQRLRPLSAA